MAWQVLRNGPVQFRVVPSRNFPKTWTWVWVRDGDEKMWPHIFVTKRHIPGSMWRCQVSKKSFKYFQKCDDFPGTWYKCDDFVTSSHRISGFGLEHTRVWKPGQVLGSVFQVFQFRLGTTLSSKFSSFLIYFQVRLGPGPLRCPSLTRLPMWEPITGPLLTNHSCSAVRA